MQYDSVVPCLLERIPEFRADYDYLIETFGDEDGVGSHVVMGGLFQFVRIEAGKAVSAGDCDPPLLLHRVFAFIEELACSQEESVQELVQVSFFEHWWQLSEVERLFVGRLLGPHATALWHSVQ